MISDEMLKAIAKDENWRICMMDIPPIVRELLAARQQIAVLTAKPSGDDLTSPQHIAAEAMELRDKYEAAMKTIARLSAQVSSEECGKHKHRDDWGVTCWYSREIDDLIAARLNPPQPEAK